MKQVGINREKDVKWEMAVVGIGFQRFTRHLRSRTRRGMGELWMDEKEESKMKG